MVEIPGLKISGPLGKGGTACVARAFSKELDKEVAVKYPLIDETANVRQFRKLAAREYDLIGRIKFPGIVQVLKHSEEPPYLLLELCHGKTLDDFGKVDDVPKLLNIISATTASLEYIRLNGIIHGDIKPHNIFLPAEFSSAKDGHLFFAKISDFSLGRLTNEPESTRAGHGTIGYAAPETMSKGQTSHRADLFALGIIAYQLASGNHPFMENESDPVKIESNIQEETPKPLSEFRSDLPDEYADLINLLLSKDASDRPDSAWEVCCRLQEIGSTFPFEKVLAPHFLLKSSSDFVSFVEQKLELSDKQRSRLEILTDSRVDQLRLVLTANFRKKNLICANGRYHFDSDIYWPTYLRRKTLKLFADSGYKLKKQLVRSAVIGSNEKASKLDSNHKTLDFNIPPATPELLHQLLSNSTIKRQSRILAPQYEAIKDFHTAAELYLKAGLLDDAVRCAEQAGKDLTDEAHRTKAIHLVNSIHDFARMQGKEFDVRQLLMIKGDIERTGGDTERALRTYSQIIDLYASKDDDKLLAETYLDLGGLYKSTQNFDAGINVLNKAMDIYKALNDELEISRTLKELGNIHWVASNLKESLRYYRKALAIQKRLKAVADAAVSLQNMGSIFGMMGRLQRTITILHIALRMNRIAGDEGEIARTLNNLGYAFYLNGQMKPAISSLKESVEINRRIGSKKEVLFNLWNLSEIMIKSGKLEESLTLVKEGIKLSNTINDRPHLGRFSLSAGKIHLRLCQYTDANSLFNFARVIAEEIDDKVLCVNLDIHMALYRFQIGDPSSAEKLALNALKVANAISTMGEAFESLLILLRIAGNDKYLMEANNLSKEIKFPNGEILAEFNYIANLLEKNPSEIALGHIDKYESKLNQIEDEVDLPKLFIIAGEVYLMEGKYEKANTWLDLALKTAHQNGLLLEEVTVLTLQGNTAFKTRDFEKSYLKYRDALKICKVIANNIDNETDTEFFLAKPKVKFLATEIKRLSEKLGAKQKAGV